MCDNARCSCGPTFFQEQNAKIERNGYTYLGVLPSEDSPGFVYTIGLSEQGKSDLIFIGAAQHSSAVGYIAAAAIAQNEGHTLTPGILPPETEVNPYGVPMAIVQANHLAETHAFSAARRLDAIESVEAVSICQIVMPDMEGRFPWEEGYDWLDQQITDNPFA